MKKPKGAVTELVNTALEIRRKMYTGTNGRLEPLVNDLNVVLAFPEEIRDKILYGMCDILLEYLCDNWEDSPSEMFDIVACYGNDEHYEVLSHS